MPGLGAYDAVGVISWPGDAVPARHRSVGVDLNSARSEVTVSYRRSRDADAVDGPARVGDTVRRARGGNTALVQRVPPDCRWRIVEADAYVCDGCVDFGHLSATHRARGSRQCRARQQAVASAGAGEVPQRRRPTRPCSRSLPRTPRHLKPWHKRPCDNRPRDN
jgi:hypothetical protein